MTESIKMVNDDRKEVPATAAARLRELMELPLKQKQNFLPAVGAKIKLGPFIFKVSVTNPSQLRFTASLMDVIIEGVNDGSEKASPIINPHTGKGIIKE